jgi:PAS domain S-box-containing protein
MMDALRCKRVLPKPRELASFQLRNSLFAMVSQYTFEATGDDSWWRLKLAMSSTSTVYLFAMADAAQSATPDSQLFRDVFNASPIGIAVENLEGQPLFVNPALCSFLGFSEEELRNKHCVDFSPPEDAQKDWVLFQQLRAGSIDHYRLEKRYFRRDGSLVWGSLSISLLKSSASPLVLAMVEDITDKKKAEEARFRLAAVVESSDDAIASRTLDGIIVSWNTGAEKIYGYTEAEAVGKPISMLVPPELPDEENKILGTLKSGDRIEHFETVRVTKTGEKINVSLSISPIKNSSGAIVGLCGIARDITARKRGQEARRLAEQELARVNERLHLAIESGSVGGWDYDLKTGKDVWFGKAHVQLRMAPDETSGSREEFWARVHEDDREHLQHAIRVARDKHEEFAEDFRVVWPDGTTHWLRSRGRYYYAANGEPERMLGISVDITQSKQAEQTLRESEQRLRLATQAGRMYAYDWDITTDVVVRSSEHVDILGLTEPLRFPHQQFVDNIHPDDRPKFLAAIAGLTPENPTGEVTYRALGPDGTLVWLKSNGRGFFDAEGRMLRVIGMVADVTDVKRAEEALAGMSRKLIQAQEQERARIARELHDDINQRLAMLAIELEGLPDNPSEVSSRVQELRKQTIEISNDVQDLSHDLHSSQVEYLGAVAGVKGWCKEFGQRQGIQIDCSHDGRSILSPEIGLCVFRIVQEALHNAAKHSGVKRMEVQLHEESDQIHLTIRDLGKGFDVGAAMKGPGLGLTSMQERVRLVNGTIEIQSKPMGGTTIHVRVPLGSEEFSERAVG